ncbi:hypothetical protein WD019_09955 [Fictibacillus sp. Mic-4]|uniref:hypothetical protein n=1 Tax=Fictibacillus TaxID=1329200 RepID=UPI0003FD3EED|nr:hypothetical protein [Fictibacillus gelatini]
MKDTNENGVVAYIQSHTSYDEATIRNVLKEESKYLENQHTDVDMDVLIDHLMRKTNQTELAVDDILEWELRYYEQQKSQ